MTVVTSSNNLVARVWQALVDEAQQQSQLEPMLASFYHASILSHKSFTSALAFHISSKLHSTALIDLVIRQEFEQALASDTDMIRCASLDLEACFQRDPACSRYSMPFLYFKGYHALQAYRLSHYLWQQQRRELALFLQNRIASVFDVDIHPAARLGHGIMMDHATAIVIGETAVIGNNVSLLHSVTLGGCGNDNVSRHPVVADGVMISTGAKLLGAINIGEGAKIAAGSLVLETVPPHTTVAGVPAKPIGQPREVQPALDMNQQLK